LKLIGALRAPRSIQAGDYKMPLAPDGDNV
jgi:hypothetical protein